MYVDLAVFAWEYAMAQRWARWGVSPDAVLGIGAGVLAAAVVAGIFPLREAARLAAKRSSARPYTELVHGPAQIPAYWADNLSEADGALSALLSDPGRVLLEAGTGQTLISCAARHTARTDQHVLIPGAADEASMLSAAGRLWLAGVSISWEGAHGGRHPAKVQLPTYPFERQRYLIEPENAPMATAAPTVPAAGAGSGDVREVVTRLFGEILGLGPDDLDPDESFFDLGGDSLVATRLLVEVRKLYQVELALRSVFEAPTANAFAALVQERVRDGSGGTD
jgi:acyl transferase domain-containing protein